MTNPGDTIDQRAGRMHVRTYVRIISVLFLVSMVAGFFGEMYAPSRIIVSRDAAATAHNIVNSSSLFRLGFAGYLIEAMCDIALALFMYFLLKPVKKELALLAAFFGLVSTATFAGAQLLYFGSSLILGGADYLKTFSPDQLYTLALLSVKYSSIGSGIFMVFYGTASFIRGYLIYRSDFLPKFLGVLLMLGGLGFIMRNFLLVLAPAYASSYFYAPMFLGGLSLTGWFIFKGVDVAKWEAKAAGA